MNEPLGHLLVVLELHYGVAHVVLPKPGEKKEVHLQNDLKQVLPSGQDQPFEMQNRVLNGHLLEAQSTDPLGQKHLGTDELCSQVFVKI